MDIVRLEDVSEKGSSNLAQKDIEGLERWMRKVLIV